MKADVLALVQLVSNNQADPSVTPAIYDEVVNAMGARPIITNATLAQVAAGQTEFSFPADTILSVLGLIFDQRELGKLRLRRTGKPQSLLALRNRLPGSVHRRSRSRQEPRTLSDPERTLGTRLGQLRRAARP